MKAIRIHCYGGPEVLQYEDAPRPKPQSGEVLIRVNAAGVNPIDWKVREGHMKDFWPHKLPLIPGWDVSGTVEEVGAVVSRFKIGDEVYSVPDPTRNGAYAEYIVVRESEIAPKPNSLHHIHAAAAPLAALTAWQSLFDTAQLQPGQRVLIHGGSGGVGHFAVQLAKWKRAYVFATASTKNQKLLRELGADETIDYTRQHFEDVARNIDIVLDPIGGDTQERSWQVLKKGGILLSVVEPPSADKAKALGIQAAFVASHPNGAGVGEDCRTDRCRRSQADRQSDPAAVRGAARPRAQSIRTHSRKNRPSSEGGTIMTNDQTILITGVTGNQGGAVAQALQNSGFRLRGLTRKPESERAAALARIGVDVVEGDLDDEATLRRALAGAWGVFGVQNAAEAGVEREEAQGKRLATQAREAGVEHYVYTSVGSAHKRTGVPHFDNKWRIEETVRGLRFPSHVILRPVFFMENLVAPFSLQGDTLAWALGPGTKLQMIAVEDIGWFGARAFTDATALNRREIDLAGDVRTMSEAAEILKEAMGRPIAFAQTPIEQVRQHSEEMALMLQWFERVGYSADIAGLEREFGRALTKLPDWARSLS